MRLKGRVAIVTGGASGIGRACSLRLAAEGAGVLVADMNEEQGHAAARLIQDAGGHCDFIAADVSAAAGAEQITNAALAQFGRVDVLVNSAGIAVRHVVHEESEEDWSRAFRMNVASAFLCSKFALPHMMQARAGNIIHMSSVTGLAGVRNRAAYSATKGAIIALTRNMALDYAQYGIRVNCICPGFTRTPLIERLLADPERARKLTAMHPLGRLGEPADIANAVLFLASDESSWITGHALAVDGGFAAGQGVDV